MNETYDFGTTKQEKPAQSQGRSWNVSLRTSEFETADAKRKLLMSANVEAKVQRLADGMFLVKTRENLNSEKLQPIATIAEIDERMISETRRKNPKQADREKAQKKSK